MDKNKDQKTDGKGTAADEIVVDTTDAANAGQTSDTSTDESKADETKTQLSDEPAADAADGEDDDDEEEDEILGDDGEKKFTQTDLNKIVKERLKKEKAKSKQKLDALAQQVEQLNTELSGYRQEAQAALKAEFDSLADDVKALAPGDISKVEDAATLRAWLPKAKQLSAKLVGETKPSESKPEEKKKVGNVEDPAPLGNEQKVKDEKDLIAHARKHSIYSSF